MLFEGLGGFDGLYMKMLASDVPTSIQLMWIPFSELSIGQHLLLMMRFAYQSWMGVWNSGNVTVVRQKIFERFKNLNEDILLVIVFPIVEFVIPSSVNTLTLLTHYVVANVCLLVQRFKYVILKNFLFDLISFFMLGIHIPVSRLSMVYGLADCC